MTASRGQTRRELVARRVAEADPQTLAHLRGLSQVFSGYNLYDVCNGYGLSAASMELSSDLDDVIEERLMVPPQPQLLPGVH